MELKKLALACLLLISVKSYAQQYSLYNTRTLFDAFENPSQKTFIPDSSRRFAFNFFIPNGGISLAANGPAQTTLRTFIYEGGIDARDATLGNSERNRFIFSGNTYIAMLRYYKSIQYNREMGFSWQVRGDVSGNISNETFAIFQNYKLFALNSYNNPFNNSGNIESYHQFSLTYRENYDKRLAFGAKLSYLSGIAYSKLNIGKSHITVDQEKMYYSASLDGSFKSNFLFTNPDSIPAMPGIKNPGASISLSANYRTRNGWFLLGNLKDVGFIRWKSKPYYYNFKNAFLEVNNASDPGSTERLNKAIEDNIFTDPDTSAFTSLTNAKAEVLINKNFNNYHPNLILIKNLTNWGTYAALTQHYQVNNWDFSLSTAYGSDKLFLVGAQLLYKSPNAEFFLGSDQLLKTVTTSRGIINEDPSIGQGYTGASLYMGFAVRFGKILDRSQTSSFTPGVRNVRYPGLTERLLHPDKKKKKEKESKKKKGKKGKQQEEAPAN